MTERLDDVDLAVLLDGSSAPIPSSLHERFVTRADDEGLIDVAYTTVDTRIGPLLLAASPLGLLRVAFALEGFDAVRRRAGRLGEPPRPARAGAGSTPRPGRSTAT